MAAINGVVVSGTLVPTDTSDTYAVTDNQYAIDGHRSVPDIATRDAIPIERRRSGMLCAVHADTGFGINAIWQLNPPPWALDATDWVQVAAGDIQEAPEDGKVYGRSNATWVNIAGTGTPGGTNGQLQYNNSGAFGGLTMSGDATMSSTGMITVLQTNGVLFGTMATQNAASVAITGGTITGLLSPVANSDAATKNYVDTHSQGLVILGASAAASATGTNIPLTGGATLTVDGYTVANGDRILLKDQTNPVDNGIYDASGIGTAYTLTRSSDMAVGGITDSGSYTHVVNGTTNAATGWVLTTADPITIGTTSLTWTLFSTAANPVAGFGIDVTGNTISIDPNYPGQTSITTLGTVTTGTIVGGSW
jgi:hypothetical protein